MTRILLIDDESNIRMMMQLALQAKKHTVESANDGVEGLRKFGDGGGWDLVLLDQRMPGMAGLEVLSEMKQRAPNARIVLISAFGTYDLVQDAMEAGATDFLRKPFTLETLRGAVQAALDRPRNSNGLSQSSPTGAVFVTPAVDGYRIESRMGDGMRSGSETLYSFVVRSPEGEARTYTVRLPDYVRELVKARLDCETVPEGSRFWQAYCEEVVTQHLWQHAESPEDGVITISDFADDMKRWTENTLKGLAQYNNAKGRR